MTSSANPNYFSPNRIFMKRLLVFLFLFFISLMLMLGCSVDKSKEISNNRENILSVYNWSTYIDPEVITKFEQEFDVKIKYDTYESNEDLYAKLKPGNPGYDVIFPSGDMVEIMIAEDLLEPLNLENIPNIKHIDPKFIDPPFDPDNKYSLPYQWGTMGLGYNIKATGGKIDSWTAAFDSKYKGRVALMEDVRATLGLVLIYLGYDPNTTNQEEIEKAKDYIIEHREAIAAFAPDTGQLLLDQGEVDIALEWSGDVFQVMEENPDLRYVIPKEGSIVWTDNMAIAKGAPNKELAERFINFILDPEIGAQVSNFIKYGTPNKTAKERGLIEPEDLQDLAIYPPPEVFKRLQYIKDVGEATVKYDEAWTEIKVGVGG